MSAIYATDVTDIDGQKLSMSTFRGHPLLIVNVASQCGLTKQYEQLEELYEQHKSAGLTVLGFPCNQFAGQEPGDESEIKEFCRTNFGVQFPLFSKIDVNGSTRHPLYQQLVEAQPKAIEKDDGQLKAKLKEKGLLPGKNDDISWNFEKFLVNADGKVVARFAPDVEVTDKVFRDILNSTLNEQ